MQESEQWARGCLFSGANDARTGPPKARPSASCKFRLPICSPSPQHRGRACWQASWLGGARSLAARRALEQSIQFSTRGPFPFMLGPSRAAGPARSARKSLPLLLPFAALSPSLSSPQASETPSLLARPPQVAAARPEAPLQLEVPLFLPCPPPLSAPLPRAQVEAPD